MTRSEVSQEMQNIVATCEAMRLYFNGFAQAAPHFVIKMRYKTLDNHRENLAGIVGEEAATDMLCDTYNRIVK